MHPHTIPLLVLALTRLTHAAIIEMFRDEDCWGYLGEVNVWDNTCASWMETEWKSFRVRAPGGWGQEISSYKHGVCLYPAVVCTSATEMGRCVDGYGRAFGSALVGLCKP